jgi:hypothetical protein
VVEVTASPQINFFNQFSILTSLAPESLRKQIAHTKFVLSDGWQEKLVVCQGEIEG